MLRRASQFATVLLVIAMAAMPVMACMVPDRQMTAEEQSCCKKMAHNCESSVMPASHSCCQHPVSQHAASASSLRTDYPVHSLAVVESTFIPSILATHRVGSSFESPPESPLKISSVLRI
jgi:hypothetical protein